MRHVNKLLCGREHPPSQTHTFVHEIKSWDLLTPSLKFLNVRILKGNHISVNCITVLGHFRSYKQSERNRKVKLLANAFRQRKKICTWANTSCMLLLRTTEVIVVKQKSLLLPKLIKEGSQKLKLSLCTQPHVVANSYLTCFHWTQVNSFTTH